MQQEVPIMTQQSPPEILTEKTHALIVVDMEAVITSAGVMIIINPALAQAGARAGKLKPVISSPVSKFPSRMIGVTLSFQNFLNRPTDKFKRKAKGSIKLFL